MGIDSWLWSRLDLKHALIALGAIPWCPKTRSRPWCPKTRSWSPSIDQEQPGNCRISVEEAAIWPGTEPYRTMDIEPC